MMLLSDNYRDPRQALSLKYHLHFTGHFSGLETLSNTVVPVLYMMAFERTANNNAGKSQINH